MKDSLVTTAADTAGEWAAALGTAGVFLLAIVIVWQIAATWRARMLAASEQEHKELAQKYARLLEDHHVMQRQLLDELGETRRSVGSMERMMREID